MSERQTGLKRVLRSVKRRVAIGLKQSRRVIGSRRGRSFGGWRRYLRRTPAVGYVGWVGRANLGDEALYDAFVALFPGHALISTNDPLPIEMSLHAMIIRGGKPFDAVMLGGGTLIFHKEYAEILRRAQARGVPTAVFGTGVIDAGFWSERLGELGYDPVKDEWVSVLKRVAYIGVRGPESVRMLEEVGIRDVEIIGDPALSICPEIPAGERGRVRRVAMNTGNIGPAWGRQDDIERCMGQAAGLLLANEWGVDFFGMHAADHERASAVISANGLDAVELWSEFSDTHGFLERLSRYDIVISQKLHGVVLAAGLGIPCISVAYEPKCIDFMRSIDMDRFVLRADKVTPEGILGLVEQIDAEYESIRGTIRERVNHWRECQRMAAIRLSERIATGKGHG